MARPWLSIVIPLYNEVESLKPLHQLITEALGDGDYEVVYIDDGSTDGSLEQLRALLNADHRVRVVTFARNFGKAEALSAGFREATGEVIVTMDADLQDDPREIPRLVAALATGFDMVNGWKRERRDPASKTVPSRVFNAVAGWATGVHLRDLNSGLKAYRRAVVEQLHVYGELHRFLPVLAAWQGFRVTEIAVRHHPRRYGQSKYGPRRFLSGALDLLTVVYLTRFQRKPLHLFGSAGLACLGAGMLINLYLSVVWLGGEAIGHRPLLQLGVLLMVLGVQFLSLGLLAEMVTLNRAEDRRHAHVYEVLDGSAAPLAAAEPPPIPNPLHR
jgi:glycosyltransferase involved in cell wall biosynthesis